ncbi:MAG: hypothetical protein EOP51_01105 [Sphingobacteriales bacterium]|nr:MAG: hypothetical protein EOP51_01105 [Sphingobacteriales bacterium]
MATQLFSKASFASRHILSSIIFLALLCLVTSCTAKPISPNNLQGRWLVELEFASVGKVRTVFTFKTGQNTFEAYTRKNADRDIMGNWKSLLARTFTRNFKNGSLIRIKDGSFEQKNDTLFWTGNMVSALGTNSVKGFVANGNLYGQVHDATGAVGRFSGAKTIVNQPIDNYPQLFNKALQTTQQNIYNHDVFKTDGWITFEEKMKKVSVSAQDDVEFVFAFFYYSGKLPFSHYSLLPQPKPDFTKNDDEEELHTMTLEEKTPETAYLKIESFSGGTPEVDSLFRIIERKNYKNLIVDLRNNPGGSNEAGMAFAAHLTDSALYGGILLTQKYFNTHNGLPTISDYQKFQQFTDANFNLLMEGIHNTEGLCLKVIPAQYVYKGKLYLLTNKRTASTCEPIVYVLKQHNLATVVGERTAGAMLNAEFFELDKRFTLMLPTADYYTPDGYRIDQNGVVPSIETKPEEALDHAMKNMVK